MDTVFIGILDRICVFRPKPDTDPSFEKKTLILIQPKYPVPAEFKALHKTKF